MALPFFLFRFGLTKLDKVAIIWIKLDKVYTGKEKQDYGRKKEDQV